MPELLSFCHVAFILADPRGRRKDGRTRHNIISFLFFHTSSSTDARSFEGCRQPASSLITSCAGYVAGFCSGSPRRIRTQVRAHKPIDCPLVLALGYIHCAHLQLRSNILAKHYFLRSKHTRILLVLCSGLRSEPFLNRIFRIESERIRPKQLAAFPLLNIPSS